MLEPLLSKHVVDAFFKVYHELGFGFLESVYANSLATELEFNAVALERQFPIDIHYRGKQVGRFRFDLVVGGRILVEIKSTTRLVEADERQLLNYLKATPIEIGLLLHFGPEPKFLRRVLTNDRKHSGLVV